MAEAQNYIGGAWMAVSSGGTIDLLSPSDSRVFSRIADGNADDIERAVCAARASFSGEWRATALVDRGVYCQGLAR